MFYLTIGNRMMKRIGWRRTALDQNKWRELEEAYVRRQPNLVADNAT